MGKLTAFFQKNIKYFFIYLIVVAVLLIELPYYIDAPGGLINVSNRVEIEGQYSSEGTFNLAYVSEYSATLPMLFLSLFNKDWKVYEKGNNVLDSTAYNEAVIRDRLWIKESYANAVILSYQRAGKKIEITGEEIYSIYIHEKADTDLKVGDKLLKIDGTDIANEAIIFDVINSKDVGDKINLLVENDGKQYNRYAKIIEIDENKVIGFIYANIRSYNATPAIELSIGASESGPSGGLMIALAIYDALTEEDMTGGKTVVGTGTISIDGSVGDIGGVEYKIKGAVRKGAEIFFIPAGSNYEEAKKLVDERGYKIILVPVSTFDEALEYLRKNVAK